MRNIHCVRFCYRAGEDETLGDVHAVYSGAVETAPLRKDLSEKIKQRQSLYFDKRLLCCLQAGQLQIEAADSFCIIEIL